MENYFNITFTRAVASGNLRILKQMLKKGADVNRRDSDARTPLIRALDNGHYEAANLIIEAGADVNICDSNGKTLLNLAAEHSHSEAMRVLIKAGADVNKSGPGGKTLLIKASETGDYEMVRLLVESGADVNKFNIWNTPLWYAVKNHHIECVSLLIEAGADVNLFNPFRAYAIRTAPFICAVINNYIECASILMEAGADVNYHNVNVLGYVRSVEMVRLLLRSGSEINIDWWYINEYPEKPVTVKELLFAAGYTRWRHSPMKVDGLMGMCREVIRKHLLELDPYTHLFGRVTRLGLPAATYFLVIIKP